MPPEAQAKISLIHEGVDVDLIRPDSEAALVLPNGVRLSRGDPVVTYVARYLEPYRGFPSFLRAMEKVLAAHDTAQVLVVGEEQGGYGRAAEGAASHKEKLLGELALDLERVHFLGRVPYDAYRRVLQVSGVHVYLTYPFVLSWSMLQAMASECLVVASDTAPVTEVIRDGENGLLVDFHDPDAIAARVLEALERPGAFTAVRAAARQTICEHYDKRALAGAGADLLELLARGELPPPQEVIARPDSA